jgi:hypothetical protein
MESVGNIDDSIYESSFTAEQQREQRERRGLPIASVILWVSSPSSADLR